MKNKIQFLKEHLFSISFVLIIIYQFFSIFQGFDLTDESWGMYFYQQIFKNPDSVIAQMPYFITGIIGGALYSLYPIGGFFYMRLIGVALVSLTYFVSYKFLSSFVNRYWVILGLIAQIIIVVGDPKPFGYNSLTAFFTIISIISFYYGLIKNKIIFLFLGGVILGINVFVRIPNIMLFFIILSIPAFYFFRDKKINKNKILMIIIPILGFIIGMFLVIVSMKHFGYWDNFLLSFNSTVSSASDNSNSHQLDRLILVYLKNYYSIFLLGLFVIITGAFFIVLQSFNKRSIYRIITIIIFTVLITSYFIFYSNALRDRAMYFVNLIAYSGCFYALFNKRISYKVKWVSFASVLMLALIPVGSDYGILTVWVATWLGLPFGLAFIYEQIKNADIRINRIGKIDNSIIINYIYVILIGYSIGGIYKNDNYLYYDIAKKFDKIYPINNIYCNNIYTVKDRSVIINELLPELQKYVRSNDYLLVDHFLPGINYMTDTRSYTSNVWTWCMSGSIIEYELQESYKKKKILPVIVRQNFMAANLWQKYNINYTKDKSLHGDPTLWPKINAVNKFVDKYQYIKVWSNGYFDILLPKK